MSRLVNHTLLVPFSNDLAPAPEAPDNYFTSTADWNFDYDCYTVVREHECGVTTGDIILNVTSEDEARERAMMMLNFSGGGVSLQGQVFCTDELVANDGSRFGYGAGEIPCEGAYLVAKMDETDNENAYGQYDMDDSGSSTWFNLKYRGLSSEDHKLELFDVRTNSDSPQKHHRISVSLHYAAISLGPHSALNTRSGPGRLGVGWDDASLVYHGSGWATTAVAQAPQQKLHADPTEPVVSTSSRGDSAEVAFGLPGGMNTANPGDSVCITFFGTSITVWNAGTSNRAGSLSFSVSLDGGERREIITDSNVLFEEGSGSLSADVRHTVNITLSSEANLSIRGYAYLPTFETLAKGEALHVEWEKAHPVSPGSPTAAPTSSPTNPSNTHTSPAGPIAGAVAGFVALVLLCMLVVWVRCRRRDARLSAREEVDLDPFKPEYSDAIPPHAAMMTPYTKTHIIGTHGIDESSLLTRNSLGPSTAGTTFSRLEAASETHLSELQERRAEREVNSVRSGSLQSSAGPGAGYDEQLRNLLARVEAIERPPAYGDLDSQNPRSAI